MSILENPIRIARHRHRLRLAVPVVLACFSVVLALLIAAAPTIAQEFTPTPADESDAAASPTETPSPTTTPSPTATPDVAATEQVFLMQTEQAATHIAATEQSGWLTQTKAAQDSATATQSFLGTQTAIAPKPTSIFQPFGAVLFMEPRKTSGTYNPNDEVTFTVHVTNIGQDAENRTITVAMAFDTTTFVEPVEGSITSGGQIGNGSITWKVPGGFEPGENNSLEFMFKTSIRPNLTESKRGTVEAVITNQGGVVLAQPEPIRISIEPRVDAQSSSSTEVPQGEGLFRDSKAFTWLIGLFFGFGVLLVFMLSALVIYRSREDEVKEQTFANTTEITLLLIVLFSVIVMGVQNAIDRESINAIIGGIVGYVAGRARSRINSPQAPQTPPPIIVAPTPDATPPPGAPDTPETPDVTVVQPVAAPSQEDTDSRT